MAWSLSLRSVRSAVSKYRRDRANLDRDLRIAREKAAPPSPSPVIERLRQDPCLPFRMAGLKPDPWQERFLRDPHTRQAMLCSRRAGKTVTSAAKTLAHCLTVPDSACAVFSPTMRQSVEYARQVRRFDRLIGNPVRVVHRSMSTVEWANGSRLLSLPDSPDGVVGFTPTRVVIDEGSRVSDALYMTIRPMLALGATLEVLSTPFGKRGWFFGIFDNPIRRRMFRTWEVTAAMVPRISAEFLEEERLELGDRWFMQEYYLAFNDSVDAVFSSDVIDAAFGTTAGPLFQLGA